LAVTDLLRPVDLQDGGQRAVVGVGELVGQRPRQHLLGDAASPGHRRRPHHGRHARHEAVQVERLRVRGRVLDGGGEDELGGETGQLGQRADAGRDLTAAFRRDAGETDVMNLLDPRLKQPHISQSIKQSSNQSNLFSEQ